MSSAAPQTTPASVTLDGVTLASLRGDPPVELAPPGDRLWLSRFAWLRREGNVLVAESPLSASVVALEDSRTQALALSFHTERAVDAELAQQVGLPLPTIREVAGLLCGARVLIDAQLAGSEDDPPLAVWEFHDLLFHSRSRPGRHSNPSGGTYRFLDRLPPDPAFPRQRWTDTIDLEQPDYEEIERRDPPLARVQALRRSDRRYGSTPVSIGQLATFLARVGRVEDYWETPIPGPAPNTIAFAAKPYPSGGALYELEMYVAVHSCEGLERGLYHYMSEHHRLARVCGDTPALEDLIARSAMGIGATADSMQAVVLLSARFARLAWKYQSIAYALVLKHVGVVFQTMYLVATAMWLAPCAIGTGDSDLFARASGLDYYEEPAVGEFALGSKPQ